MNDLPLAASGKKWQGALGQTPAKGSQPASVKWEFAKSKSIKLTDMIHDWSAYRGLAFTAVSNKKSNSKVYIIIYSENKGTRGSDYYEISIRLNFKGAKDFIIPFAEMRRRVRRPVGFRKIDTI
ncbi:MAG: hypothetical protein K8S55_01130, partial [Phycisphaerae bacterium]|nr:hypothetical protein [Phycisphaerae bacterium]